MCSNYNYKQFEKRYLFYPKTWLKRKKKRPTSLIQTLLKLRITLWILRDSQERRVITFGQMLVSFCQWSRSNGLHLCQIQYYSISSQSSAEVLLPNSQALWLKSFFSLIGSRGWKMLSCLLVLLRSVCIHSVWYFTLWSPKSVIFKLWINKRTLSKSSPLLDVVLVVIRL